MKLLTMTLVLSVGGIELEAMQREDRRVDEYLNVVWCGMPENASLESIAAAAAPVLWFSPDEPLFFDANLDGKLARNETTRRFNFPNRLPEDYRPVRASSRMNWKSEDERIVYYRLRHFWTYPNAAPTEPFDSEVSTLDLREVGGLEVEYFFYYERDYGVGRHAHDIEAAIFHLTVVPTDSTESCLELRRVDSSAHGVEWYTNTLEIDASRYVVSRSDNVASDVSFPITLFVEEGKHASCPDRNSDGRYDPGYDVNLFPNDAWGVRDTMRSERVFGSSYSQLMTKTRKPADRLTVKEIHHGGNELRRRRWRFFRAKPPQETYSLVPARGYALCVDGAPTPELKQFPERFSEIRDPPRLAELMEERKFCQAPTKRGGISLTEIDLNPYIGFFDVVALGFYYDGGPGWGIRLGYPINTLGGFLVIEAGQVWRRYSKPTLDDADKKIWGRSGQVRAYYMPSASRWFDWYAGGGIDLGATSRDELLAIDTLPSDEAPFAGNELADPHGFWETGLILRAQPEGIPFSFRLGLRTSGFTQLQRTRLVLQIGMFQF